VTIKQVASFDASAEALYKALMTASKFAEWTGAPADITEGEGGAFSCFGGQITGRHIELLPNSRIVQVWRVLAWDEGVYSVVRFDISESEGSTTLELTHSAYPEDAASHLEPGWHKMYWEPLKAYLA
jgi:activator of HSP90 ATPase